MDDSTNIGRVFEQRFYDRLKTLDGYDSIYEERDLRKMFGWDCVAVDFLVVKGDLAIAIQTKYKKTRRREDKFIGNFINSIDSVLKYANKDLLAGFWVSRIKPFDDNIEYMSNRNIHCVSNFDNMDYLIDDATKKIKQKLLECQ